jgi:Flp pilus assembly protein TadG
MFTRALRAGSEPPRLRSGRREIERRRGAIIVLTAILLVLMMGMLAFSIDVGYMYTLESQLQRSVDAAALAGAGALVDGQEDAQERVAEYLVRNPIGGKQVVSGSISGSQISQFQTEHASDLEVKLGHWDPDTRTFEESDQLPSTISVAMTYHNNPLFFARFLGEKEFSVTASSVAMYQPRDIVVVLDYSASMNDDSEFTAIPTLGRSVVEANLLECWNDLGPPTYGNLTFEPKYITVTASGTNPTTSVEYRYQSVYVSSSHTLQSVILNFSDGSSRTWSSPGGKTGTFSYNNKVVTRVRARSNSITRDFNFSTSTIDTTVKNALGLSNVAYPYSGGSWDDYIDWCQSSSEQNDDYGGYRWKFGGMSLMVYWLENYPSYAKNPDLWKTHAQPVKALKDATDVFMDFIQQVDTDDRVALAIYNANDGEGILEHGLTNDFDAISTTVQHRQAGHYHDYTNIGGGLHEARLELDENGRPGAFKMIVLMTDGQANWVNGNYNESAANNYLLSEAQLCAQNKYPIVAVSLGAGADTDIMQQVADATPKGKHFNIPGGQTGQEYYEDLLDVFEEIAKDRPLKLVK